MNILHGSRLNTKATMTMGFIWVWLLFVWSMPTSARPFCSISTFAPAATYDRSGFSAFCLATGDFTGDGRSDVVEGGSGSLGGLTVFLNDGAGRFGESTFYATGEAHSDVITGDFNGDGKTDIAAGGMGTGSIDVLLGNGNGGFGPLLVSPSGGIRPSYIASGDFNGDGKLDLAVSNTGDLMTGAGNNLSILLGDGSGGFSIASMNSPTVFMRAADLNGDGIADAIGNVNPSLAIELGTGSGHLSSPVSVNGGPGHANHLAIADLNHDGKLDLAVLTAPSNVFSVSVILGNGDGTFGAPVTYPTGGDTTTFVDLGDVNGDGILDIVAAKSGTPPTLLGRVFVFLGAGNGTFSDVNTYILPSPQQPLRISSADLNGDGRADIVTQNLQAPHLTVMMSTCLAPTTRFDFDGDGKADIGVFRPSTGFWYQLRSTQASYSFQQWGLSTDRVVTGDFDGDLKTDLAVYRPSTGTWYILQSSNNAVVATQFGNSTDIPVPGDYDADGRADLAVFRPSTGTWYVQFSNDQSFYAQAFGTAGDRPFAADMNGNGQDEIGVFRPSTGEWFYQDIPFGAPRGVQWGTNGDLPVIGDFDGDGKADVAVYRPSSGVWYAQQSSNGLLRAWFWGNSTDTPVPADYDGDGKTDIAVYRPSEGMWYIQYNATGNYSFQQFGTATDIPIQSVQATP